MTTDDIAFTLSEIRCIAWDCESAHRLEDSLRAAFIEHVAATADEPLATMARMVLTSRDIEFSRWYT
jgi:hypothetical protein